MLRDYSFLADGYRGVLVGPRGDCSWMCFPGWSDPAVFASLIGSGGSYVVQPSGRWVWGGYYEDGTLIWTSRWVTEEGIFESREALAYPGSPDRALLLRRLYAVDADGELDVALDPRADYGRRSIGAWHRRNGCWEVRGSGMAVRWWGGQQAEARPVDRHHRLEMRLGLEEGSHFDLVLELISRETGEDAADVYEPPDPDALWRSTEEAWRREVPTMRGDGRRP